MNQMNKSSTIIDQGDHHQQQPTNFNNIEDFFKKRIYPLSSSIASPIPILNRSKSSPFSSQIDDHHQHLNRETYSIYHEDSAQELTSVNDRKKFSFSSITSVSDSGNESIVDEEMFSNEKILDYFVQDNSKTVKLARKRLSGNYQTLLTCNDDEQYDSDDESTLSESSFTSSPSEFGTPRANEAIFDFDTVCAVIDEKLVKKGVVKDKHGNYQYDSNLRNDNMNEKNCEPEKRCELNQLDSNILEKYCDNNNERRNSVLIRSTSLKTGKTPPGTPGGGKKIVRFADALGLDLASIRHIVDDVPYVPPLAAFRSLQLDDEDRDWLFQSHSNNQFNVANINNSIKELKTTLRMLFGQPSSDPLHFMERVRSNKVCLENCMLTGPTGPGHIFTITCLIRVLNICFHKKVLLRYTTNEWLTWNEISGTYVDNSNDGFSDKFTVHLELAVNRNGHQTMLPGQRLLFAIRYLCNEHEEYWDNNIGMNYALIYQRC